jgi:hypothetical protein
LGDLLKSPEGAVLTPWGGEDGAEPVYCDVGVSTATWSAATSKGSIPQNYASLVINGSITGDDSCRLCPERSSFRMPDRLGKYPHRDNSVRCLDFDRNDLFFFGFDDL